MHAFDTVNGPLVLPNFNATVTSATQLATGAPLAFTQANGTLTISGVQSDPNDTVVVLQVESGSA